MSNIIEGITKDLKAIPKNLKAKAGGMDTKKLVLLNLPYIFVGYFCDKVAWLWRVAEGTNASDKMMAVMNRFDKLFANPLPSFHPRDLLIGVAGGIALRLVVYYKAKNAKKFRQGVEYGSARWGNAKDIEPYMDSVFENNVLLTQTERLMMSGRPKEPKYARNKNILVIGGSGSGKTRFFVKPNLMQMHSSYVVTDPKGTVLVECGKMLKRGKYKIKVLNTINFAKSMHYNPFAYIRSEKDILKLVNTIIVNTKGEGQQSGEDFWVKAEKLYYTALIAYIWYEAPEEEQNFAMLIDMIDASEAREDDENFKNAVDLLFEELETEKPNHFAVRQYKKYKLAAGVVCSKRLLRDTPLTLADERIARAIRENNARLVIIDPVQAFLGADVDMNRANEVRPIFRSLGDIAQATGCAIVLIGHLNKAAGTQSTYRGLGSIDITAAVRSLLFIGKLKDSPTTRVLIHEKSSLAPPGQSLAFSLGDEKGFEWIGAYDITADELLAGTDTAKTESKTAQAQMLILELLADGKRMPSAELEKAVNERGISSRTMRTAKSRIGDRLVTEKDGTAWVCYLRD